MQPIAKQIPSYQNQKYSIFLPHPMLPVAYPYLQVHNKLIVWQMIDTIQVPATTPAYKSYMEDKHNWTPDDSSEVNWNAVMLAKKQEWCNLQKYLHNWLLPYRASKVTRTNSPQINTVPLLPTNQGKPLELLRMHLWQTGAIIPKSA